MPVTFAASGAHYLLFFLLADSNTIGSVASVASIDWGCAVQIMAAASIGTNESFSPTSAQTLFVSSFSFRLLALVVIFESLASAVYALVVLTHAVICCFATRVLARLQTVYVVLNVLYVLITAVPQRDVLMSKWYLSLCLAVIIGLPAATPKELKNTPSFALGNFTNCEERYQFKTVSLIISYSERLGPWIRFHSQLSCSSLDHL